jgi:hypothetical protein
MTVIIIYSKLIYSLESIPEQYQPHLIKSFLCLIFSKALIIHLACTGLIVESFMSSYDISQLKVPNRQGHASKTPKNCNLGRSDLIFMEFAVTTNQRKFVSAKMPT